MIDWNKEIEKWDNISIPESVVGLPEEEQVRAYRQLDLATMVARDYPYDTPIPDEYMMRVEAALNFVDKTRKESYEYHEPFEDLFRLSLYNKDLTMAYVRAGADVNGCGVKIEEPPLFAAIHYGIESVFGLIEIGADAAQTDVYYHQTALMYAIRNKKSPVIIAFLAMQDYSSLPEKTLQAQNWDLREYKKRRQQEVLKMRSSPVQRQRGA